MDYHALEKMTVHQLREEAKKIPDAKGVAGMKKEELITIIAGHLGLEKPVRKAKKKKRSAPLDKKAIKKMIAKLKEERDKARSGDVRKEVSILRKRIHALKRRLRKVA